MRSLLFLAIFLATAEPAGAMDWSGVFKADSPVPAASQKAMLVFLQERCNRLASMVDYIIEYRSSIRDTEAGREYTTSFFANYDYDSTYVTLKALAAGAESVSVTLAAQEAEFCQ